MGAGRRRGVSEVVASLVLLFATLSLSLLVFIYSVGALSFSQSAARYEFSMESRMLMERFSVVDVWFRGGAVSVAVFNHGRVPIRVAGMYVNGSPVDIGGPVPVGVGEVKWVSAPLTYSSGAVYRIKVVTELGGEAVVEAKAPG